MFVNCWLTNSLRALMVQQYPFCICIIIRNISVTILYSESFLRANPVSQLYLLESARFGRNLLRAFS